MKTRFIMVRHGFSVANDKKCFAGNSDFDLTELGLRQAEKCAEALKNEKIDAVYASDLKRAYRTAVPIAAALGLEINKSRGLREIFAGKWEGMLFDDLFVKYAESYTVWRQDIGKARCDGGESVVQLSARVLSTLEGIAAVNDGKVICIATHATPIRAVCTAAAGLDASEMAKISWVSNASISIIDYEDGRFMPVSINNSDHLGDLITVFPANV